MPENNDQNNNQEWLDELAASLQEKELSGKSDLAQRMGSHLDL